MTNVKKESLMTLMGDIMLFLNETEKIDPAKLTKPQLSSVIDKCKALLKRIQELKSPLLFVAESTFKSEINKLEKKLASMPS